MNKYVLAILSLFYSIDVFSHGFGEHAKRSMIEGGNLKYIWLGAEHMITGYDHLLFLFGVIFFLATFKDIVKFITAFTLGHSITLIFATFMGISANYWLIDAVIALSVCYKGFDNNRGFQKYFGFKNAPNLLLMVFIFGLIHGFGLSTRLQQLSLGEKGMDMLMRIISFNIGVEFGQIIALTIMLMILSGLRHSSFFDRLSKVANNGIILAGFMLLLMQLHGYLHASSPQDFNNANNNNISLQQDMDYQKKIQHKRKRRKINEHKHKNESGHTHYH